MKRYGIIYKLTNKINGKVYIGKTTYNLSIRLKGHLQNYSSCSYIKASLKKYGVENFLQEEIFTAFDKKTLADFEEYFIISHGSLAPKGYNIVLGSKAVAEGKYNTMNKIVSGWARTKAVRAYNIITGKSYFFPRMIDASKKLKLSKSVIEKNISFNRISKGFILSYANQSGSVVFKNTSHAQRLELETEATKSSEYNSSTSVRVPRCYDFSSDELNIIKELYKTKSYREVAKIVGLSDKRCLTLLTALGVNRNSTHGIQFREERRKIRNIR